MFVKITSQMRIYYLCLFLFLFSCKSDTIDSSQTGEEEYFEDYVSPSNKWGYIDPSGNIVIEKKFDDLRPFKNGLARANLNGKWGFIDKTGSAIIAHEYRGTYPFKEDLARIQNFEKEYGFIDKSGKMIIPDTFDLVFDFNSGRARAKKDGIYGYIDTKGKWVIDAKFKKCSNFENGVARVYQYGKVGVINEEGQFEIPFEDGNEKMWASEGSYIRAKKNGKYRFYDLQTNKVVLDGLTNAIDFKDDLTAIQEKEGMWSIVDKEFNQLFEVSADKVKYAGNEKWIVIKEKKYSLYDMSGKLMTSEPYDMIYEFNDGYAPFEKYGKWGYLNEEGSVIKDPVLPLAWEFNEGFARVIHKGYIGYINKEMKLAFDEGFIDAHNFSEGLAHVQ